MNAPIDLSATVSPAPLAVYRSLRYGAAFSYGVPGFAPNQGVTVRLHFVEPSQTAAGKRLFDITINGIVAAHNFDVFALAGGENKGLAVNFPATADALGRVTIAFSKNGYNVAFVNGIEIR